MTCAQCGGPCEVEDHEFYEGLAPLSRTRGQTAVREWTVSAPRYFFANADFTAVEHPFCSAECCTRWYERSNYPEGETC